MYVETVRKSILRSELKFSVVTISYNQSAYIAEAMQSVLGQSYRHFEYIVVDAGSTDGSRQVIDGFSDDRLQKIFELDKGPADGLNKGFSRASGDIYGFLNADDVLEPEALMKLGRYLDSQPSIDVVSGNSFIIDRNGVVQRRFYSDQFSLTMAKYGASILSQPSTFFRNEVFRRVGGFNPNNLSNWDGELFIDFAMTGAKFSRIPEILSRYRVHEASITGSGELSELHRRYRERMFHKITGRVPNAFDAWIGKLARVLRKIRNPRDALDRIVHGPIYRSAS